MSGQIDLIPPPQILWNHKCHEAWANEHLQFWRFRFAPRYNAVEILARLKMVLFDKRIISYAIYEMTGQDDLLVRLWMPPSVSHEDFETALSNRLDPVGLQGRDAFFVHSIINHWVWDNNGRDLMRLPSPETLSKGLSDEDIQRINSVQFTAEEFEFFRSKQLIAPVKMTEGIKFVVLIPPSGLPVHAREHLKRLLKSILAKATSISEVSLYCGAGIGEFLLMGKVEANRFTDINLQLIQPINGIGIGDFLGVRTFTYIIITPPTDSRNLQDNLPLHSTVLRANEDLPLSEYLKREEEEKLEFKASAFSDLKAWAFTGNKTPASEKLQNEGVVRAVVGQLNASGGKVIIGVLESQRFSDSRAQDRVKAFPQVGKYMICGINVDYESGKGWDEYQRRLEEIINARIVPSPRIWVSMKVEKFEGFDICVVSVRSPNTDWFYVKGDPTFYVRHGNATRPFLGPEADDYKRVNPR